MLIQDMVHIGEKLFRIRKHYGLTQHEVAEAAGIADKTYARLERGTLNIRTDTLIKLCNALHITPDEILTDDSTQASARENEILARLHACNPKDRETALRLLDTFLKSLEE
ncbi:MAG: helix-turn-helix transcriptional regulator [Clostridiales bacterium]|nr:helix-turn-helix transcriptional regulator [Clostridiales bacterium]